MLHLLNLVYTASTGLYYFIDTGIPVPVFFALHLLVTDPATSPRTTGGKLLFGAMYGFGVFGLYELLGSLGVPLFYDKLLTVPLLNLGVPWLDQASRPLNARWRPLGWSRAWSPRRVNLAHMAVWASPFVTMITTGFLARNRPGADLAFWRLACEEGSARACRTWMRVLAVKCRESAAEACETRGRLLDEGRIVARDSLEAGRSFGLACDLGLPSGCDRLRALVRADGPDVFVRACDGRDGPSCFILGSLYREGLGVPRATVRAVALFGESCASGWAPGCNQLGRSYLSGEGTMVDLTKAMESFEKACRNRNAAGCYNAAAMHQRGMGAPRDEKLARQRFRQACELGLRVACE